MTISLLNPDLAASISPAESAELAARLNALAKSGLALEGGLRALAAEAGSGRLAHALCRLAERLENGEPLEKAIDAPDCRLPVVLRGLIVAGLYSGRLPEMLDLYSSVDRRRHELRRRLAITFAYPAILLGIISVLLIFCSTFLSGEYVKLFREYRNLDSSVSQMPGIAQFYVRYGSFVGGMILAAVIVAFLLLLAATARPVGRWLETALSYVPVLGPMVRHEQYVQFSRLMAALLEAQVTLPQAMSLAAIAMRGTMLARRCDAAIAAVLAGTPLDEALANAGFLESLTCFVSWGQTTNSLAEAFAAAAKIFDARANSQAALLKTIVLPLIYLLIVCFVGFNMLALIMPVMWLIPLLSSFSGGGGGLFGGTTGGAIPPAFLAALIAPNLAFTIGAAVLLLMRWHSGPSPGESKSILRSCARGFAWMLLGAFVLGSVMSAGLGVVLVGSLAAVIAVAFGRHAATQQFQMLAMLGAAAERSVPLADAFAALGHERGGWMQRRARRIAGLLLEGVPLPVALEKVPGVLPPEAVPLVRVGHDTGSLPGAIQQALSVRNIFEPISQTIAPKAVYICIFPGIAMGLIAFIAFNIVPTFEYIFRDFNLALPEFTCWVFDASETTLVMWILGTGWLLATCGAIYGGLRYAGSIRWDAPGLAWLTQRQYTATVLDGLALAAGRQKPLMNAVMQMALGFPQRKVANRLRKAYGMMESGENDLEALRRAGLLGESDVALLRTAQRNGNMAWAARELADSNRRRMIYRTHALAQIVFPAIICCYAAVVALVWAAMLLPLAILIKNLSLS